MNYQVGETFSNDKILAVSNNPKCVISTFNINGSLPEITTDPYSGKLKISTLTEVKQTQMVAEVVIGNQTYQKDLIF